jgi:hypothetical protein
MKTRFGRMTLAGLIFCPLLVGGAFTHPAASGPSEGTARQTALVDAARKTYEVIVLRNQDRQGDVSYEQLYVWSWRWMDAQRASSEKVADRVAAVEAHLGRMKDVERLATGYYYDGRATADQASAAVFYRLEAELLLADARAEK